MKSLSPPRSRVQNFILFSLEFSGACLFFVLAFSFRHNLNGVTFYTFMSRDMDRALELLKGHWIFFGPETTGGGNLPGPLLYFMLAAAMVFSPTWQACYILLEGSFALTAMGLWALLRQKANILAAMLLLVLLALSNPLRGFMFLFLNLSYLLPFALAGVFAAALAFSHPDQKIRNRAFLLACVMIGLGIQLHFSMACLLLALVFMQLFSARLKLERVEDSYFNWSIALIALTSLPYLAWRACGLLGWAPGQMNSFVGNAPGSILTLFTMAEYSLHVSVWITLREVLVRLLTVIPFPLLAIAGARLLERVRRHRSGAALPAETTKAMRALFTILVWSFVPFSYVFMVHMGRRYGMIFCISLIYATVLLLTQILNDAKLTRKLNGFMGVILVLIVLGTLWRGSQLLTGYLEFRTYLILFLPAATLIPYVRRNFKHSGQVFLAVTLMVALSQIQFEIGARVFRDKDMPRLHSRDWRKVWHHVCREAHGSYEELVHRMYFVNLRLDEDPKPSFAENCVAEDSIRKLDEPDGFFVLNYKAPLRAGRHDTRHWLLEQHIPQEIKDAIMVKTIELGKPEGREIPVIPYRLRSRNEVPTTTFHDSGEGYRINPGDHALEGFASEEGVRPSGPNTWTFRWNECPTHNAFCSTGAVISWRPADQHRLSLHVEIIGAAISQNSPWISPSWTQAWIHPSLTVRCADGEHRLPLFPTIGYVKEYSTNENNELIQANNSIVAPLTFDYVLDCGKVPLEITLGREGSAVQNMTSSLELPAKSLSLRPPQTP